MLCPLPSLVSKIGRTDGWDGSYNLAQLQLVKDGRFTSGVQADHQDTHLLLAPEAIEELRERKTHLGDVRRGGCEVGRDCLVEEGMGQESGLVPFVFG